MADEAVGSIATYNLGEEGVVITKSPVHGKDGELARAQNAVPNPEGGLAGIRKRQGMVALNGVAAAGAVLALVNVPLVWAGGTDPNGLIEITITANDLTKYEGAADPTLTYTITSGSLLDGDSLTGSLTREAGEALGSYAITQGTLAAPDRYAVTFVSGTLTIEAVPVVPGTGYLVASSVAFCDWSVVGGTIDAAVLPNQNSYPGAGSGKISMPTGSGVVKTVQIAFDRDLSFFLSIDDLNANSPTSLDALPAGFTLGAISFGVSATFFGHSENLVEIGIDAGHIEYDLADLSQAFDPSPWTMEELVALSPWLKARGFLAFEAPEIESNVVGALRFTINYTRT